MTPRIRSYGKTRPFEDSRETVFDVNIDKIDIPFYLAYLPVKIPVKVPSGNLDVKAQLIYREDAEDERMLSLTGRCGNNETGCSRLGQQADSCLFRH